MRNIVAVLCLHATCYLAFLAFQQVSFKILIKHRITQHLNSFCFSVRYLRQQQLLILPH